jgi:hypothetical protein
MITSVDLASGSSRRSRSPASPGGPTASSTGRPSWRARRRGPSTTGCRETSRACSCARYENVVDEPRELLAAAGLSVAEPSHSGKLTWCCGGPAEALYPEKAAAVAAKRVEQLRAVGADCVTMCPICLVNLRKSANGSMRFRDISDVLMDAATAERSQVVVSQA